ncbi:MAG TPA: class II aldolase/adducin family protein [Chloroflexota bacterium]|nr:class II aldolase/adducin family protein [Chloroflexota bacterium]
MDETELKALRQKVAISCRILAMLGLVKETTGHVSARIPDSPHMFIRGRGHGETGLLFTTEDDILRTDFDGKVLGHGADEVGTPRELPIHGEIYKFRPEAMCVVHAHPPGILMCGLHSLELRPIFGAYDPSAMKIAMEGVPVYPRAITVTSAELAAGLLYAMAGKDVVLMRGHGITAIGRTIEEATVRAIKLESLARITWHAGERGPVADISDEDKEYYGQLSAGLSSARSADPVWRYYVQMLEHQGILPDTLVPQV